jgi:hypothetical protein
MGMLEGQVRFVIGVDTHRDTHTAAVCDPTGTVLAHTTVPTTTAGHRQLLGLVQRQASGRRVWAVEGTGSFGAGLTSLLVDQGEWVVVVDRPKRPARRNGATRRHPAAGANRLSWPSRTGAGWCAAIVLNAARCQMRWHRRESEPPGACQATPTRCAP